MPAENEKDLEDILEDVREDMTFHFVEHMDEVLLHSLVDASDADMTAPKGDPEARRYSHRTDPGSGFPTSRLLGDRTSGNRASSIGFSNAQWRRSPRRPERPGP